MSTRQEQALRKKRHWQKAHGSQQAGAGGLQLSRVATQGPGGGGRGCATFFIEAFFCGETPGLPEQSTSAPLVLTSAWRLLGLWRPPTRHPHLLPTARSTDAHRASQRVPACSPNNAPLHQNLTGSGLASSLPRASHSAPPFLTTVSVVFPFQCSHNPCQFCLHNRSGVYPLLHYRCYPGLGPCLRLLPPDSPTSSAQKGPLRRPMMASHSGLKHTLLPVTLVLEALCGLALPPLPPVFTTLPSVHRTQEMSSYCGSFEFATPFSGDILCCAVQYRQPPVSHMWLLST